MFSRRRGFQPGFVLPMVAWISVVVALLIIGALDFVRSKTGDMSEIRAQADVLPALHSGMNTVVFALYAADRSGGVARLPDELDQRVLGPRIDRIFLDGSAFEIEKEGRSLLVQVWDEVGLPSLNALTPDELSGLFDTWGLSRDGARRLADSIADYRDRDAQRRQYGAEDVDYTRAGLPPPKNRNFFYSGELGQVLGQEHLQSALGFGHARLFGYSPESQININSITRPLLVSVFQFSESSADRLISERKDRPILRSDLPSFDHSMAPDQLARLRPWPSDRLRIQVTDKISGRDLSRTVLLDTRITRSWISTNKDTRENTRPMFEVVDVF